MNSQMIYTYMFEPASFEEFKQAVMKYVEISDISGEKFSDQVRQKIEAVCMNPFHYRNKYKFFREAGVKNFPYCIVFFIDEEETKIIISAIYESHKS